MQKVLEQLCESNLAFFANTVLVGPEEEPFNGEFLIGEHHEEWAQLLNEFPQLCILAPRGHGKSHFFTVAYALWMVCKPGTGHGLILSGGDDQAVEQLGKIKWQVENNPKLAHLMPDPNARGSKWSEHHLRFANGKEIRAKGFMTKIRGGHPNWIVLDDVVNEESAFSESQRLKVKHFFFSVVYNMKHTRNIKFIVVGTPQHASDLYGILKETPGFHFRKFQAVNETITFMRHGEDVTGEILEEIGGPESIASLDMGDLEPGTKILRDRQALWPEVMPLDELDDIKLTSGELVFARERQCDVVNDEASLFPFGLFRQPGMMMKELKLGLPADYWDRMGVHTRYIGVDFAISASVGADYTVLFVVGIDDHGNRWVIDIIRDRGLDFQDQLHMIHDAYIKYQASMVYCESNQFQRIFGDELIRTSDIPIRQVVTGSEKHSLERGLPSLRIQFENRKYRIPRGCPRSIEMTDIWMKELQGHTLDRGRVVSTTDHDDCAMANYVAEQAVRDCGFSFSFGEEPEDEAVYTEMMREMEDENGPVRRPEEEVVVTADGMHPRFHHNITGFSDGYSDTEEGENTSENPMGFGAPTARDILAGV